MLNLLNLEVGVASVESLSLPHTPSPRNGSDRNQVDRDTGENGEIVVRDLGWIRETRVHDSVWNDEIAVPGTGRKPRSCSSSLCHGPSFRNSSQGQGPRFVGKIMHSHVMNRDLAVPIQVTQRHFPVQTMSPTVILRFCLMSCTTVPQI